MQNVNEYTPNLLEVISKEIWHDWEAACILYNLDPKKIAKYDTFKQTYVIGITEPQKLLDIIKTWHKPIRGTAHPFWYINECLKKGVVKIPTELLQAISNTISRLKPKDRQRFIDEYGYLADELNLSIQNNPSISTEVDEIKNIIDETYNEFWLKVDGNKPPKSEAIITWILTKFPHIAKRTAEVVDASIRPKQFRTGGNRSRKS